MPNYKIKCGRLHFSGFLEGQGGYNYPIYRILRNFRGKIISLFSRICLQPRNFNYTKNACSININDNYMAILENIFAKETSS